MKVFSIVVFFSALFMFSQSAQAISPAIEMDIIKKCIQYEGQLVAYTNTGKKVNIFSEEKQVLDKELLSKLCQENKEVVIVYCHVQTDEKSSTAKTEHEVEPAKKIEIRSITLVKDEHDGPTTTTVEPKRVVRYWEIK